MNGQQLTDQELLAYLDEMLPVDQSAQIEKELRESRELQHRAALLLRRRDSGGHTLGEIWRRKELSCPNRETLGSYILGVTEPDEEDYIIFHTTVIGCRICQSNLRDLQAEHASEERALRQNRYFESSAGLLRSQTKERSD